MEKDSSSRFQNNWRSAMLRAGLRQSGRIFSSLTRHLFLGATLRALGNVTGLFSAVPPVADWIPEFMGIPIFYSSSEHFAIDSLEELRYSCAAHTGKQGLDL
jgi:hypothetical protein